MVLTATAAPGAAVDLIVAPFHVGARDVGVGRGPQHLIDRGLETALRAAGANVRVRRIDAVDAFEGEIGRSFEAKRRIAVAVAEAVAQARFPLVLAGNCNASVGTWAGLGAPDAHVVWFDAHADFNMPDECMSGYFDSMGVATLAGQCWRGLTASVPGFAVLPLERLVYVGIRDFEPGQREKVAAHGICTVDGDGMPASDMPTALDAALAARTGPALVHLDLDVLDARVGHANAFAAPGGPDADTLLALLTVVRRRLHPAAMTVASYEPGLEGSDAIAAAGVRAAVAVACGR